MRLWFRGVFMPMAILCGICAMLMYPTPARAQAIPEPSNPSMVGWFCPDCGALVPVGQSTCPSCGYSTSGRRNRDTTNNNTTTNSRPHYPAPATPTVSAGERRQQAEYAREKQALLEAFKLPDDTANALPATPEYADTANAFTAPVLPTHFLQASGLSEAEWARARSCQAEIDALTSKGSINKKDSARLANLLTERNTLWAKATSAPGLTTEEREQLQLNLSTLPLCENGAMPSVTTAMLQDKHADAGKTAASFTENPIALTLVRQLTVDSTIAQVEQSGETWAGNWLGDAAGERFGTVLGLTKVAVTAPDDPAEGLSGLGDVLVGLIPIPQASGTLSAGRLYGNLTYQAMNNFMTQSMKVTGSTVDTDAFWKELDDELSVNMRAYRKWIGFGS
ncbi:MAG TPA: zinc ribbon domain-containing protein [Armatimonadota bacterium]|nr:zinc ribbon domain-containing protein [Armatimonadota bacterium]